MSESLTPSNTRDGFLSKNFQSRSDAYADFEGEQTMSAGIDFWRLLEILRRWFWLVGLVTFLGVATVYYTVSKQVPLYKASALVEVKQKERNIVEVSAVENVVVDKEFLVTQIELLKSRSLVEDTVETLNLLNDPYLAPLESENWPAMTRENRLRVVVGNLSNNLTISPIGRSRLIQASVVHSDPEKAAIIVNALTENFIANGLSRKFNAQTFAREFLQERLEIVRVSLERAERDLVAYATNNNIFIVDTEKEGEAPAPLDVAALETLSGQLTDASVKRVAAEQAYKQASENDFAVKILENNELAALNASRIELNSLYVEKLATYKPDFPEILDLKSRIELIDQEIKNKTDSIVASSRATLKKEYEIARSKERDLQQRVDALKDSVVDIREKSIDYNILKRQVETERTQYEALLQRLKEVSVSDDLGSSLVEVVDGAEPPQKPFKPNRRRALILAFLLSGLLGYGIAYGIELIDDRIKGPEDLKNKLKQIIMGVIPTSDNPDDLMKDLVNPQSTVSEAYASLRTNLQFSGANGGPRVIQITSTRSGEGKSVTSLATALRYAGIGQRVLLIDADMRLPTFTQIKGQPSIGLSGLLTQQVPFEQPIRETEHECLWLLPSGITVPNPSEILASQRFDEFLEFARESFDYVIVDSPPVLGLADAPILGAKVDASLLVVEAGILRTPAIKAAIERLKISGTKLLGAVLTKYSSQSKGYMNYYQYTYGSGASEYSEAVPKAKKAKKSKNKFSLG